MEDEMTQDSSPKGTAVLKKLLKIAEEMTVEEYKEIIDSLPPNTENIKIITDTEIIREKT